MQVYRIEYCEYEHQFGLSHGRSDYFLTTPKVRHVMPDNSVNAVSLLRADVRRQIEIASIEHICKIEI